MHVDILDQTFFLNNTAPVTLQQPDVVTNSSGLALFTSVVESAAPGAYQLEVSLPDYPQVAGQTCNSGAFLQCEAHFAMC